MTEPTGRARGAIALAEKMSPEERQARAEHAAAARWGKPLNATHKGNFKAEFGLDVECYVLNDALKTAVISQTGMAKAIGLSSRGNALPRFLASQAMAGSIDAGLKAKLEKPLVFQWAADGAPNLSPTINGNDATVLIDVCNAILTANAAGHLKSNQQKIAQHAAIVVGASAKSGIRGLVYALAGYNPSAQEVITAFKTYVRDEARKYEQEFPPELYMQWHRLYEIPVPIRGKPWHFKHLTVRHIYYPLAKSNGRILDLLRALKSTEGDRQKKLFQFLSDVGARALRMQIGRVLEMCESAADRQQYENKIVERFGGQQELELVSP